MGSLRSTSHNTATGSTTCTVTKPTGTVSGDLLVAAIGKSTTGTPSGVPSGWVVVTSNTAEKLNNTASSFGNGCGFYYKIAGGSEGADYTWTSTSSEWAITIFCFQDINFWLQTGSLVPVPVGVFETSNLFSRSSTTLALADEPSPSNFSHDHYFIVAAPCIQEAAQTRTLSALSGYLTQVSNDSAVGISMMTGWAEYEPADDPEIGPTQCTIDNASGNARGYAILISDPTDEELFLNQRPRQTRPKRSRLVNA